VAQATSDINFMACSVRFWQFAVPAKTGKRARRNHLQ